MNNLQDLVFASLPDKTDELEEFVPLAPLEVRNGPRASFDDLLLLCNNLRTGVKERPEQTPYLVAQLVAYFDFGPIPSHFVHGVYRPTFIFTLASSYALDPDDDALLAKIEEWVDTVEEKVREFRFEKERTELLPSTTSQIDFVGDFFSDSKTLLEEIVYITGVRPATAKRWIGGGTDPSWGNAQVIELLAHAFYAARKVKNMTNEEVLEWYNAKHHDGRTTREMFSQFSGSYIGDRFREALGEVGFSQ